MLQGVEPSPDVNVGYHIRCGRWVTGYSGVSIKEEDTTRNTELILTAGYAPQALPQARSLPPGLLPLFDAFCGLVGGPHSWVHLAHLVAFHVWGGGGR